MRITFVHCLYENLGIEYISSCLKETRHSVALFFDPMLYDNYLINNEMLDKIFSHKKGLIGSVVKCKPDIVDFSVASDTRIL